LKTVPGLLVLFVLAWIMSPVLAVIAALIDIGRWLVIRSPFMALRLVAFLLCYVSAEVIGIVALGWVWIWPAGKEEAMLRRTFAIQRRWADAVFWAVRTIFRLEFRIEGLEAVQRVPFLLVARHASIVDNLLPARFITRQYGTHIRYVMKSELLIDPCLDVAGNRLPNVFVRRAGTESDREVAAMRDLAAAMPASEALLIYPEGTRFSREKLETSLRRLERSSPNLHDLARGFRSVLPPRLAGTLGLLDSSGADVVVMAHRGLDGFARVADIWKGAMVGNQVDVAFWRVSREEIPEARAERAEWLYRLWGQVDDWIAESTRRTS
jgi:hypothetical protein